MLWNIVKLPGISLILSEIAFKLYYGGSIAAFILGLIQPHYYNNTLLKILIPCVLQGLSTLTNVNRNYSQPYVNPGNCSVYSFSVVLSSFLPCMYKSVLNRRLQGGLSVERTVVSLFLSLPFPLSLTLLWFPLPQILALFSP